MRTVTFATITAVAAYLQSVGLGLFGVTPNFFLAAIFVAALSLRSFLSFSITALIGLIVIRFQPGIVWEPLLIIGFGTVVYWIKAYLPWLEIFTVIGGILAITFMFYAIIAPEFVANNYGVVFIEALYTIGISSALFFLVPASPLGGPRASNRK